MLELGELSAQSHQEMGRRAGASLAEGAAFIQGDAKIAHDVAKKTLSWCSFFADSSAVTEQLVQKIQPGDVIVVKASRGVRAERVVEGLAAILGVQNESSGPETKSAPPGGVDPT
jgi:UDP-N-acetylmuramoyl-tripeptide--D-alanyl-D-alanine ligase